MVQTSKMYWCKVFYETTKDGSEVLEVKKELSNKFIMDKLSLKCFCSGMKTGDRYYNIVSIRIDDKWIHPIKFIEYLFSKEIEA